MAACPVPDSINPLSPVGFRLDISKLPSVSYFCQEATLPDVTLGSIAVPTPLSVMQIPDTVITYGDLIVNFLVDDTMSNYKALYDWMKGLGFPENYEEYSNFIATDTQLGKSESAKNFSDGSLAILSANNTVVQTLQFRDLYPVSLASLQFGSNLADIQYLVGNAIFRYSYYEFS